MKNYLWALAILMACSLSSNAQILSHDKEIGLYQLKKNTQFIRDSEILSPKSALFIKDKLFINALENATTVIYDTTSWTKLPSIDYHFDNPPYFNVGGQTYPLILKPFSGKPVEMASSTNKLWVSFYRQSWDTNANYHSAIAQVDLTATKIEGLIPAGSIPKMVQLSPDAKVLASTNWGDNTIGLYREGPTGNWEHKEVVIEKKLNVRHLQGDRDKNCGLCLRGTVFTRDSQYLLVGRMTGGGIAVVDVSKNEYLGTIYAVPPTPRHMVLSKDGQLLYVSTMASGEVARIGMDKIYDDIELLKKKQKSIIRQKDWTALKMGSGIRTISLSRDEKYLYAAMNTSSQLAVIDAQAMKLVEKLAVASYPVGVAVSSDDRYVAVTSQGINRQGGNHVDIFKRNSLMTN